MKVDRRAFLRSVLGATAASFLQSCSPLKSMASVSLPSPDISGIEHIVVVMMENRSFDHLLGWLPHADGKQSGLKFTDPTGAVQQTHALSPDFTGCGYIQPDHSYLGGRIQYNAGKMDGFLQSGNDAYSLGYYQEQDLPFLPLWPATTPHLTATSARFWGPPSPIASSSTPERPTGSPTLQRSVNFPLFGISCNRRE